MGLAFFGLAPDYKPILHEEIFLLVYHSHGGFNWSDVYGMPIWLRKYYIRKLVETREEENKKHEAKKVPSKPKIDKPVVYQK